MSISQKRGFYKNYAKRGLDVMLSFVALILLCPILFVVYLLLRIANGKAGAFFLQERPGMDGRIFHIVKFKTMNDRRNSEGRLLPDAERLTRIGRFVRSTSIDELPQLWNVLCGDMSLIGPRPLLSQYIPLYNKEQARRHEVRPGITGWAQCHGRNAISWIEKFRLDVWYVDHVSLWVDLKIIFLTIKKVLIREGINEAGQATMEAFNGTN
ncbi:MAG: sugar transferase [Prevotella sp.]|nr:sugar transferase [Prevotella sp.]